MRKIKNILVLIFIFDTLIAKAQNDSLNVESQGSDSSNIYYEQTGDIAPITINTHSPARATLYSMLVPGLGQIYNKKYWKIPVIWGGFFALGIMYNQADIKYNEFKSGYSDFIDADPISNSYIDLIPYTQDEFDQLDNSRKESIENWLNNNKNSYKKKRDFRILLLVGLYVLNLIDASVDAHFMDYDISKDLSMDIQPFYNYKNYTNNELGINLCFSF